MGRPGSESWMRSAARNVGPRIPTGMPDSAAPDPKPTRKRNEDPNFYRVIAASIVALLLVFLGAWLLFKFSGRRLTPKVQPDPEPHSMLVMPSIERAPILPG